MTPRTGLEVASVNVDGGALSVAVSLDRRRLAIGGGHGAIELHDIESLLDGRDSLIGRSSTEQRVAVARGWRAAAALLLVDEPTANLDYGQAEGVIVLLREIASAGRTVIVSTHDDRLLSIADSTIDLMPRLNDDATERTIELDIGDVLFRQHSTGSRVYLIESGRLAIVQEMTDGSESRLAERGPGEYVGELGPMLGQPRSATTRAIEPTTVSSMSLKEFRQQSRPNHLRDA